MGDLIERQAAIDEAEEWIETYNSGRGGQRERDAIKHVISGIKKLPSAQQEVIYCKDCANRGRLGSCLVLWRNIKGLTTVPWKPDDYDFCSKAVRRTDER